MIMMMMMMMMMMTTELYKLLFFYNAVRAQSLSQWCWQTQAPMSL